MRLATLRLLSFGPFEGKTLQFSGRGVVDVVFGPNEAGKSTTRRAVRGLLFGIPDRSPDGHSVRGEVRVGGILADEDGRTLEIIRRKGRKSTLLDAAQQPLDEGVLTKWLGAMDAETFELTYGLDHVRLREGGDALKLGKGELGESLFAAATGLTGLHQLLAELRDEADALFAARGRHPALNEAVRAYAEQKKRAVDLATPPEKWLETQNQIKQARTERDALAAERAALAQRRARLDALGAAERERGGADQRLRAAEHDLAEVRAKLEAHAPAPELLAHEEDIAQLKERLGSHRKARLDEPILASRLQGLRADALRAATDVRAGATLDTVRAMRLDRPSETRVRKLADDGASLAERVRQLDEREMQTSATLEQAREAVARLGEGAGAGPLRDALALARSDGDVAARASTARRRASAAQREVAGQLAGLGLPGVDGAGLLDLEPRLPSAEDVARASRVAAELADARREHALHVRGLEEERIDLERDLAALSAEGEVPEERTLEQARAERDAAWQQLRKSKAAPKAEQAARFEAAVVRADAVADALRRDAARVSKRAQLESHVAAAARKLEAAERDEAQLREREAAAERTWADLWRPVKLPHVTPQAPREAGAWLVKVETACASVRRALDVDAEAVELEAALARAEATLRAALAHETRAPEAGGALAQLAPLPQLEQLALRLAAEREVEAARRATEQGALHAARADHVRVTRLRASLEVERAAWAKAWQEATAPLGARGELDVDAARALLDALGGVIRTLDDAEELARRLAGIERDARRFEDDVRALSEACAPDLASQSVEDACAELHRRVTIAAQDRARREELDKQRERLEAQLRSDTLTVDDLRRRVAVEAADLGVDAASAQAQSDELGARLEELHDRFSRAATYVGSVEAGAAAWAESSAAMEAAEAQRHLARVRELAERWARARLGAAAVARLLERYRRDNQGPVLARAGALFAKLTLGSFRGLEVGFGERDEPAILAVRPDDRKLQTDALSEGTLDQLYLALRIASLERLARTRGPMPLLLDDVLVHFDDARAAAAIEALTELSAHTQVILFTHHARIVDLARAASSQAVVIHELATPREGEIQPAAPA